MTLTIRRRLPAIFVFLTLLTSSRPAYAVDGDSYRPQSADSKRPHHARGVRPQQAGSVRSRRVDPARPHDARSRSAASISERLALYSPRLRRSVITYLRLRLLELRERDLDRARLAIERRLSIDELLAPGSPGGRPAAAAGPPPRRPSAPAPLGTPETNACPGCTTMQQR